MRSCKKYCVLIFGLVILMLSSVVACVPPGFTTYTNKEFGYTISYPLNWKAEVAKDGTKLLLTAPTKKGSVEIDVSEPMSAEDAAKRWIMAMGTAWTEITLIDNKSMQGDWDWYLSYDYEALFGTYHGEAYFKQTKSHIYKLDTAGDAAGYKGYPFPTIISSFRLG